MALELNLDRVRRNVQLADTEDLLDRATVYRDGMEPAALELIDAELRARGVGEAEIAAHRALRARTIYAADGLALKCNQCRKPAVVRGWGWQRLWGLIPLFPRPVAYCEEHMPASWWEKVPSAPPAEGDAPRLTPSD